MATRSTTGKPSTPKSRKKPPAVKVDPAVNRAPNAEEAAPETLVPDVVRTQFVSEPLRDVGPGRETLIAERAYEFARERGFSPGNELDDWLRAEREIDSRAIAKSRPEEQFTG